MDILFVRYNSIYEPDCISAFSSIGLKVDELFDSKDQRIIAKQVADKVLDYREKNKNYLFVFSINFFPAVSDICQKIGAMYVCWSVDSPVLELFARQITNSINRVFLFDYSQFERIKKYNPNNIYYLPLGTNVERLQKTVAEINDKDIKKYSSDISFVGSLYSEKNPMKGVNLCEKTKGFIEGIEYAQMNVFGHNFIEQALTDNVIKELKGGELVFNKDSTVEPIDRYVAAHSFIGMDLAEKERIKILNELAGKFSVDIYTRSDTSPLMNVKNKGGAQTLTEMPKIFNLSKINLNITMRPIQTGLSLRIFDVLGSGGFLITNYQSEISSLYEIGKDLVVYISHNELLEQCEYYLNHEDERIQIAQNGLNKTLKLHTTKARIIEMIKIISQG